MTLPQRWLVKLNRPRYKFKLPSDDPVQYARWEFREGKKVWDRYFASRIDLSDRDILDLGCGPGGKTCYLASLGPRKIVGVDVAAECIRKAELARPVLTPPEFRSNLEFVVVDAADLPFPDGYFDIITCSDAFGHFGAPCKVFSEAVRILKKGGLFCIDFVQWGAYNGHHLGEFIVTPWAHVWWSSEDIVQSVHEIVSNERASLDSIENRDVMDDLVRKNLKHFHDNLNRLRLSEFEKCIRQENRLKINYVKHTVASPVLLPLKFVPGLRELVIARNIYILEKTG